MLYKFLVQKERQEIEGKWKKGCISQRKCQVSLKNRTQHMNITRIKNHQPTIFKFLTTAKKKEESTTPTRSQPILMGNDVPKMSRFRRQRAPLLLPSECCCCPPRQWGQCQDRDRGDDRSRLKMCSTVRRVR